MNPKRTMHCTPRPNLSNFERAGAYSTFLIILWLVLFTPVRSLGGSYPPLRDVQAWAQGGTVYAKVYDPVRGAWQEWNWNQLSGARNLTAKNGVVAWDNGSTVAATVYDPAKGSWQWWNWNQLGAVRNLINEGGVVAWDNGSTVAATVYDPSKGAWQWWNWNQLGSVSYLTNKDGVVAWYNSSTVAATIYDPTRGSWQWWNWNQYGTPGNLNVQNGTVTWIGNGAVRTRGYDTSIGNWYDGPTKPLAYFVASSNSGNPPLGVWFWSLSVAATSWNWSYDDGGWSSEPSPYHLYDLAGYFTVTLATSGPTGGASQSGTIRTDFVAPTGSLTINAGASATSNPTITLAVSATDNSGSVKSMRFSNDASNWSIWEAYATVRAWTLATGDGTKTVSVQFQDPAGNVSSSYSDSIILDTTAPSGSLSINGGASTTTTNAVTLTLTATDAGSGVAQMRFSNDGITWTDWIAYATTASWNLNPGDGLKSVYVQFKDQVGNSSPTASSTITLKVQPSQLTISGIVRGADNTPAVSGVVITNLPGNPLTGADGSFRAIVTNGWSGTITPQKAGYTFNPVSQTYNHINVDQPGQDFTAILMRFPAETNSPSWRLTSDEVTAYASAWKRGLDWTALPGWWVPTPPNPIPSSFVARAGTLWRGGEYYTYDPTITNAPAWWINVAPGQQPTGLFKKWGLTSSPRPSPPEEERGKARSEMPFLQIQGQTATIKISVTPAPSASAYVVEDQPPAGWTVSNISEGGVFDPVNGKVKWGLFLDNQARTLSYQVTPPANSTKVGTFYGAANFDGLSEVAISGQRQMVLQPPRLSARQLTMQPDRTVRLDLGVPTGIHVVVEASVDLIHWETVADQVGDGSL